MSRLDLAMKENGVTEDDVKTVLRAILDEKYYDDEMVNGIAAELMSDDDAIVRCNCGLIMSLALLCNVSTDYLLGMSDNINTIG